MKPARLAVCQTKSDSRHAALEDGARLLGRQEHVRMHDDRADAGGTGICLTRG